MGMRCDLHVHTHHSGMCTIPVLNRFCRESYNDPLELYEILKQRGMDLVTITDHDSIDAIEPLRRQDDFFLSEEVSCVTPSGTRLHVGVYGIEERHHVDLQRRRNDLISLLAWLREERLFFVVNHVFSSLTGRRTDADFALFEDFFPAFETLNGQMPRFSNRAASGLAASLGKLVAGGSDAHTLAPLGRTWTEVKAARSMPEFLEGLRQGRGHVQGEAGSYKKLTFTVLEIGYRMMREKAWAFLFSPLLLAVPAITLANSLREIAFTYRWIQRLKKRNRRDLPQTPSEVFL